MKEAGLSVELLETRHVRDAFKAMPVKTDRNDGARHCAADAAGLVPAGTLQVAGSPRSPCDTDGAQIGAVEA